MVENTDYDEFKEETYDEDDIYGSKGARKAKKEDEISSEEEGFLQGYNEDIESSNREEE